MAVFPSSPRFGIAGLIAAMVLLYTGINLQRAPAQAFVADLVSSHYRSLAAGSVTFQMCVGAVVFLMLGRILGMQAAFLIAAVTILVIAAALALFVREPREAAASTADTSFRSLADAALAAVRGDVPGMRPIFVATLLVQLTFQSFATWYTLHATERFAVRPEDVTLGFIAWALGGVLGALPAGSIGMRIGRRNAMLLGFALMAACMLALDRVGSAAQALPLLLLASASWTLPSANAFPLFVEPVPRSRRGILAAMFLLAMALGGAIGDPLNGSLFDLFGSYRALFLMLAVYTAIAFAVVLAVPRGAGETSTNVS
jgi:predicted MFS family arabinose efflux permease